MKRWAVSSLLGLILITNVGIYTLVTHAAQYKKTPAQGTTPTERKSPTELLLLAIEKGNNNEAQQLVSKTPDLVNAKNALGQTPLHVAVENISPDMVNLMVSHNANPDAQDNNDDTPLHYLSRGVYSKYSTKDQRAVLDIARSLLKKNATITLEDKDGISPLEAAIQFKNQELIDLFLMHQGSPIIITKLDEPSSPEIEKLLQDYLDAFNTLNVISDQPKKLNEALRTAAKEGKYIQAKLALYYGANPKARSLLGKTALDIATKNNHKDIAELLQQENPHK